MAELSVMDDDRFRSAGSRYEDDEPVAFAIIGSGRHLDWMASVPKNVLWVPETLFDRMREIAARHSLKLFTNIDIYAQTRLNKAQAGELSDEMGIIQSSVDDEKLGGCVSLVRAKAEQCANSADDVELLIEGP